MRFRPCVDDHREFVGVGRVVGDAIGDGRGENVAVAVLVLQALAVEGRAARRAADQEAARAHVARRPGEVADALEAEHRIVDVERDHRHVGRRVGRARGDERGHRARLVDALLEDLALRVFAVVHQLIGVLRPIELADLAENADLPEKPLHAEGAAFVGDDRHHARADVLVAQERRSGCGRTPWWSRFRAPRRSPSAARRKPKAAGAAAARSFAGAPADSRRAPRDAARR